MAYANMDMSWYARRMADLTERTQKYSFHKHCLLDPMRTNIGRWLERNGSPLTRDLFFYFHRQVHNYVIGKWVNRNAGIFKDVFIVGPSPWDFMEGDMTNLLQALQPTTAEKVQRFNQWLDKEGDKERLDDWKHDEATRRKRHVKKPRIIVPGHWKN
jgi:hypothetical protein